MDRNDRRELHERLLELARGQATLDYEIGIALLEAWDCALHSDVGCASFAEYVERIFGCSQHVAMERLRVARSLQDLPQMSKELADGTISYSAARELTRFVTPNDERIWLDHCRGMTVRQIEKETAGLRPGAKPGDPPAATRQVVRVELDADTAATLREAIAMLRKDGLDENGAWRELARRVLGGPTEEGRASYQIALTVCERCGRGEQHAAGEKVPVDAVAVEMAECDAQRLGRVGEAGRATQDVPPAVRRAVLHRDHGKCVVPGCRNHLWVDVHHLRLRSEGGLHHASNLVTLCGSHHALVHDGFVIIGGQVSALSFQHADGTSYGSLAVDPARSRLFGELHVELRALGFKHREATAMIESARSHVGREATFADAFTTVLEHAALERGRDLASSG
jgi:hypothetical protein